MCDPGSQGEECLAERHANGINRDAHEGVQYSEDGEEAADCSEKGLWKRQSSARFGHAGKYERALPAH
jgi:hypothetical protein